MVAAVGTIEEGELKRDGVRVFYRRVEGEGTPTVYFHGNPSHSEDWIPFMEKGGPSLALDMPGWGRSDRPAPDRFDYSMYGLSAFLEGCLEELGVGRRKIVVHDWGGVALIAAQRRPELVEKVVVINSVPFRPRYRWHWIAQAWRRRPLGEILNRITTRSGLDLLLRQSKGDRGPYPAQFVDMIWDHWDQGTAGAVLALYRHADPDRLLEAGKDLERVSCPALIVWGERDPYIGIKYAEGYVEALPNAELELVAGAGHWPWVDDARVVDRVLEFLA